MAEYYVNGVIPSIGHRIAKFTFGKKLHKFEHDKKNSEYHVFLTEEVNDNIVTHFKEHWPGFKVFVISREER